MGAALADLGGAVQRTGQIIERKQLDESITAANERAAASQLELQADMNALFTKGASEFEGELAAFQRRWSKRRSEDMKSARTEQARNFLNLAHGRMEAATFDRIAQVRQDMVAERAGQSTEASLAADTATAKISPEMAPELLERQRFAIENAGLHPVAQMKLIAMAEGRIAFAAAQGYGKRNPKMLIEDLEKPEPTLPLLGRLSAQERTTLITAARTELHEQTVGGLVDGISAAYSRGMTQGTAALAKMTRELPDADAFDVRRQVHARVSLLQDERAREYHNETTGISLRIKSGAATDKDIRRLGSLRELGAITDAQHESYLSQHQEARSRFDQEAAGAAEVAGLIERGLPLDPSSAAHRKALDGAFSQAIGSQPVYDERSMATALGFAKQTRMLPGKMSSWLTTAARSSDPAIATRAAEYFTILRRNAPEAVGSLNDETRASLALMGEMIAAGGDRKVAFETMRQTVYEAPREVIERRKDALRDVEKTFGTTLTSFISRDFDQGLFRADPAQTQGLQADFARQARSHFMRTGNAQVAQDLAWSDLKRVYGVTNVNGFAEVQAFPIEQAGVKPEQARAAIEKLLAASPHEGITADRVRVVSDELTLSMVGDALSGQPVRPSYALVTDEGDLLLNADGTRARLALPSAESLRAQVDAEQEAAKAAERQKAEQERAAHLEARRQRAGMILDAPMTPSLP